MDNHTMDDHTMSDHAVWSNLRTTILVLVGVMFVLIVVANYLA